MACAGSACSTAVSKNFSRLGTKSRLGEVHASQLSGHRFHRRFISALMAGKNKIKKDAPLLKVPMLSCNIPHLPSFTTSTGFASLKSGQPSFFQLFQNSS
ncbi:unnamed protein product, partial [Ixodes pacificus]